MNKPSPHNNSIWPVMRRVWKDYVRRNSGLLLLAALLMAVDGGSLGLISYYVKPMIDEVFIAADESAIMPIAGIIFLIFFVRAISSYSQRTLTSYVSMRVISDLQRDLSKHLLTLDSSFFHRHAPGALLERVRGDSQALQSVASSSVIVLGRDSISFISLVSVAAMIDWQWTLVAFVGLPLLALPLFLLQNLIRRATRKSREAAADLSTRLDEIFHGYKAIKSNTMEDYEHERVSEGIGKFRRRHFQSERYKAALPAIIDIIAGLGFVAVMSYGAQQIIGGEKTLGDFMSFFTALALMFDPIRRLASLSGSLHSASVNLDRLYALFDEKPAIIDQPGAGAMQHPDGDIEFRDVAFAYNNNQPALRSLSFVAPAGKITALVGPSGAGKTTVFNLLQRFEEAQQGGIRIGGQPLDAITLASLRANIATVTQETALFDESIHHNIAYGRLGASETDIRAAAEQAQLTDMMAELPEGLDSPVGPRGSNLSGGQRQRVIIARALLRNAPILLLDEATSALDSATEAKIQQALEVAAQNRTSIVIAHRLSTIRKADMIHVVIDGRVVESGQHEELLGRQGAYARLYRQFESGELH